VPPDIRRPRPYLNLGSEALIAKLFEVAFNHDAKNFEDVRFEIVGGEDGWAGRTTVRYAPQLIQAAERVLEMESTPRLAVPSVPELVKLVMKRIEDSGLSREDLLHALHRRIYGDTIARALGTICQHLPKRASFESPEEDRI